MISEEMKFLLFLTTFREKKLETVIASQQSPLMKILIEAKLSGKMVSQHIPGVYCAYTFLNISVNKCGK